MNARVRRPLVLSAVLVASSAALYGLQAVLFPDPRALWVGLLSQLAFLPLYILISTLVVDAALARKSREEQRRRENVLVGVFYNELGESLLRLSLASLGDAGAYRSAMAPNAAWKDAGFAEARRAVEAGTYRFALDRSALEALKSLLEAHREDLLRLMQNPNLLEHEGFTELLLAVFHLCDEFCRRPSLEALPPADLAHLEADLRRAFVPLSSQWLSYALHLKREYPYLYSLLLRVGPFGDRPASLA